MAIDIPPPKRVKAEVSNTIVGEESPIIEETGVGWLQEVIMVME